MAGLVSAWNSSTVYPLVEITAIDSTSHITLSGDTAGVDYTVSGSVAGAGSGSFTLAITQSGTGPYHYNEPMNWSLGRIPIATDDVLFDRGSDSVKFGLNQTGVALSSFEVTDGYAGSIGLPKLNTNSSNPSQQYAEYRDRYLAIDCDNIKLNGASSARLNIDYGAIDGATAITINGGSVYLQGSGSANVMVYHNAGTLHINDEQTDDGCVITQLHVGQDSNTTSTPTVYSYPGSTITVYTQYQGASYLNSTIAGIQAMGGSCEYGGSGGITTVSVIDCSYYHKSAGTISNLWAGDDAIIDLTKHNAALTITTAKLFSGCTLRDAGRTTFTNTIALQQCGLKNITLDVISSNELTFQTSIAGA